MQKARGISVVGFVFWDPNRKEFARFSNRPREDPHILHFGDFHLKRTHRQDLRVLHCIDSVMASNGTGGGWGKAFWMVPNGKPKDTSHEKCRIHEKHTRYSRKYKANLFLFLGKRRFFADCIKQ